MKTAIVRLLSIAFLSFATLLAASAADKADTADKKVKLKGTATCAKCSLKLTDKCQNVIQADGKTYYVVDNDTSKSLHEQICKATKKVKASGTVKEVDGKLQFTAQKLTVAKE